jgi:hypothetical protein
MDFPSVERLTVTGAVPIQSSRSFGSAQAP